MSFSTFKRRIEQRQQLIKHIGVLCIVWDMLPQRAFQQLAVLKVFSCITEVEQGPILEAGV